MRSRALLVLLFFLIAGGNTAIAGPDILQGTLDLMVLKTLDSMGPLHGYGIARRLEQASNNLLHLNQGTIYPALLRLRQRGRIVARWGESEYNRRAKYYELTRAGRRRMPHSATNTRC
jgi:PadR family transcriptional regulator, regulatory protein PadR